MADRRPFCADLARENGEPLGATASRIDRWLLVEYRGLWASDALPGSGLSDQVKAHLLAQTAAVPRTRLLFIRRPDRRHAPTHLAYAAVSAEGAESLRRYELGGYEELRAIDFRDPSAGAPVERPLFLVCTHGKHDPCCARYGRPLFDALRDEVDPEWVWQTTHVGGDRFAGNLVCLPEGIYYGRVDRADASRILDEHLAGRILLELYRGRSTQSFRVQAAERALREATGAFGLDDLRLSSSHRDGDALHVSFDHGGDRYQLVVHSDPGDLTTLTCHADAPQRPPRYTVTSL